MQNIKFRVWSKNKRVFLHPKLGCLFLRQDGEIEHQKAGLGGFDYDDKMCYSSTNCPLVDCIIEQFSGKLDLNNKKIFAGDLVKFYPNKGSWTSNNKFEIIFKYGGFGFFTDIQWHFLAWEKLEIVGNIHE